jgi:hypothetical protein
VFFWRETAWELPQNVKELENGDVYIQNIPKVNQGQKGYCVVTTTQQLIEYYGIQADQHQIAQVAGTTDRQTGER